MYTHPIRALIFFFLAGCQARRYKATQNLQVERQDRDVKYENIHLNLKRENEELCETYQAFEGSHVKGGQPSNTSYSQKDCEAECSADLSCWGYDFQDSDNPYQGYPCWLHSLDSLNMQVKDHTGIDHYTQAFCSACEKTYVKQPDSQMLGAHHVQADDVSACQSHCADLPLCLAFDWNNKNTAWRGCWIYVVKPEPQQDTTTHFKNPGTTLDSCSSVTENDEVPEDEDDSDATNVPENPDADDTTNVSGATDGSEADYQRTVIMLRLETDPSMYVFFRGGSCPEADDSSTENNCPIPITYNDLGAGPHYEAYNDWRMGDTALDWAGGEAGQGTYQGRPALGSPGVWTTSVTNQEGYQSLNSFSDHVWMLDIQMDCSQTVDGWFEFKGYEQTLGWEQDVSSDSSCSGTAGGAPPFSSINHLARCGYANYFEWEAGTCQIDAIPPQI